MHRQICRREQVNFRVIKLIEYAEGFPQAKVIREIRRVLRATQFIHHARTRCQVGEHDNPHLAIGIQGRRGAGITFLGIDTIGRHIMALAIGGQRIGREHLQRFHFLAVTQADLAEFFDRGFGFEQDFVALGFHIAGIGSHLIIGAVTHKAKIITGSVFLCGSRRGLCSQQRCRLRRSQTGKQKYRGNNNFHLQSLKVVKP
ncbi:hypothetical protein D3C80_1200600 [compost metagenome]